MRNFSEASFSEALGEIFTLFVGLIGKRLRQKIKLLKSQELFAVAGWEDLSSSERDVRRSCL